MASSMINQIHDDSNLTDLEKKIIEDTWKFIYKDSRDVGIAIFIAYFIKYPRYQEEFELFKDESLEDLPNHEIFNYHVHNVMSRLNCIFESIYNPPLLEYTLKGLGQSHYYRGQLPEHFLNFKEVMMDVLCSKYDAIFTDEVKKVWTKALDYFMNVTISVF